MTGGCENMRLHVIRNGSVLSANNGFGMEGFHNSRGNNSEPGEVEFRDSNSSIHNLQVKVEDPVCATCHDKIVQRYLLQVNGHHYHTHCLACCVCNLALQTESSCFIRDGRIYCKADYYRTFGSAQCAKCTRWISSTDWVRRARDSDAEQIYHLACFACDACHRQLSTGEEFALVEKKLLCKTHYQETVDSGDESGEEQDDDQEHSRGSSGSGRSKSSKTKRVRTTFTDEQLQILQANFQIDSNPDGQDLERIAQITGLSKRVTQVWFQNSRARQKKHHHHGSAPSTKSGPPLNNNVVPGVMIMGGGGQSSSAHHHAMHHQQQISRVLTRDRAAISTDNLGPSSAE